MTTKQAHVMCTQPSQSTQVLAQKLRTQILTICEINGRLVVLALELTFVALGHPKVRSRAVAEQDSQRVRVFSQFCLKRHRERNISTKNLNRICCNEKKLQVAMCRASIRGRLQHRSVRQLPRIAWPQSVCCLLLSLSRPMPIGTPTNQDSSTREYANRRLFGGHTRLSLFNKLNCGAV